MHKTRPWRLDGDPQPGMVRIDSSQLLFLRLHLNYFDPLVAATGRTHMMGKSQCMTLRTGHQIFSFQSQMATAAVSSTPENFPFW